MKGIAFTCAGYPVHILGNFFLHCIINRYHPIQTSSVINDHIVSGKNQSWQRHHSKEGLIIRNGAWPLC